MTPQEIYRQRLCNAEDAVKVILSGRRIFVGSGAAEPESLVNALTRRAHRLDDTQILNVMSLGVALYTEEHFANHFRSNSFFIGPNVRAAVNEARADYTPIFLSEMPALMRRGQIPVDYALIQVTPPDEHGYCSLGVSVDVVKAAVGCAAWVIAEVNHSMPRTLGDSFVHVSEINAFVESNHPLPELDPAPQDETVSLIGQYVSDLIEDGATIQTGIGGIPDAVLSCLGDKNDLGIHTEMFSDGVMRLVEQGVITGRCKSLHPRKIVATFCMGTDRFYRFVDNNPAVELRPTEYVNDPFVIAQNDRMVAINSAIEIDITGQVCADSFGEYFYSGIGGQVDFIRGAARSRQGRPVIAMPSSALLADGTRTSRIVSTLRPGAGVVTSRGDVHYVVTEYGIAYLHGKTIRDRALALISIAHPDFRESLLAAAKARHIVLPNQSETALAPRYPRELETTHTLPDHTAVLVRPIRPTDEDLLREFHYQLSDETVYRRYRRPLRALHMPARQKLVNIDYQREMAMIATYKTEVREELLAIGRYFVDDATRCAELAFTVRDDWHDRGIGSLLMQRLLTIAEAQGLASFEAYTQPDNHRMIAVLMRHGFTRTDTLAADLMRWYRGLGPGQAQSPSPQDDAEG